MTLTGKMLMAPASRQAYNIDGLVYKADASLQSSPIIAPEVYNIQSSIIYNFSVFNNGTGILSAAAANAAFTIYQLEFAGGAYQGGDLEVFRSDNYKIFDGSPSNVETYQLLTDSTTLFGFGDNTEDVNKYTLSTAWDITTRGTATQTWTPSGISGNIHAGKFNSSGTVVIVFTTSGAYQYSLSTAYDLSTVSSSPVNSFTTNGFTTVFMTDDGTKLFYSTSVVDGNVRRRDLSTAFDLSTLGSETTYGSVYQIGSVFGSRYPCGFGFNSDGTKFFVATSWSVQNHMTQGTCSTAYDLSTISYLDIVPTGAKATTFPLSGGDLNFTPSTVVFQNFGSYSYAGDFIYDVRPSSTTDLLGIQWQLSTPYEINTASFYSSSSTTFSSNWQWHGGKDLSTRGNRTVMVRFDNLNSHTYLHYVSYSPAYPFAPSLAAARRIDSWMIDGTSDSWNDAWCIAIRLRNEAHWSSSLYSQQRLLMLIRGGGSPYTWRVRRMSANSTSVWSSPSAWSLDSASGQFWTPTDLITDEYLQDMEVSPDGRFIYLLGKSAYIYQYELSSPWDLSGTITFSDKVKIPLVANSAPETIRFDDKGTRLYVSDLNGLMYQYSVAYR